MEISHSLVSCLLLVVMVTLVTSMSLGNMAEMGDSELSSDVDQKELEKRGQWGNGQVLEQEFVDLVDLALQKLASDERINPNVVPASRPNDIKQKRGRFQGFCFRKTSTGRFLPFVCWKSEKRRK